jgi:hypothetical protein
MRTRDLGGIEQTDCATEGAGVVAVCGFLRAPHNTTACDLQSCLAGILQD